MYTVQVRTKFVTLTTIKANVNIPEQSWPLFGARTYCCVTETPSCATETPSCAT